MIRLSNLLNEDAYNKYKIFIDMDGVICDFDKKFAEESEENMISSTYEKKYGKEKFWAVINKTGKMFWATMDWTQDGKTLWRYIKKYSPAILSSAGTEPENKVGKKIWIKQQLGTVKNINLVTSASIKKNFATPDAILIDDYKRNIDQWNAAGGIGILYKNAASVIAQLKKLGL